MDFQKMPVKIIQTIFTHLTFSQVSEIRGLSRNVNCAARKLLNDAFLDLGPRLATQYTTHLIYTNNTELINTSEDQAFRGRLLKLLSSEHSILLAYCRRYITNGINCFSAGKILDLFYELERNQFFNERQDEDNKRIAKLVLLIDQYLDWFEKYGILPDDRCTWFGACVIDLLDSYLTSRHYLVASHSGSLVKLDGEYIINGWTEAPPKISVPLGSKIGKSELLQILRYLRKHARWHNFVRAFQDDCDKGDIDEEQEKIYTKRTSNGYEKIYKRNPYGMVESYANFVSLQAVISLHCHKSLGPGRLNSHHNFEKLQIVSDDTNQATNYSTDNSIIDDSMNLNELVENARRPFKLMKNETGGLINHRRNTVYMFNLELRSVHPKISTESNSAIGQKFCDTRLNVNHTFDSIFAVQTECRLY